MAKKTFDYASVSVPVEAKAIVQKIAKKTKKRQGEVWLEAVTDYAKKKKVKVC